MEDTTMMDGDQPLFEDLTFTIIPNGLSDDHFHKLADHVVRNGGTLIPFDADVGRIGKLSEITHIISLTSDFPDYHAALDLYVNVVKPAWIDACLKISKVKNPRAFSPDPALFMNEVIICCGNIPEGDKEAIAGGVLALGGQHSGALSKQVTHLIALGKEDERVKLAMDKRLRCSIVLPHWFDDCLKLGRRISEDPYTLPDPEILDVEAGNIRPARASPLIREAIAPEPANDPVPPPTLPAEPIRSRAIQAFKGKSIMLGDDLQLNSRLKGVIEGLVQAGGGQMTSNVDAAHIYVCNYRAGADYIKASQAKKDVGNLSWLYFMIAHNAWTNPMRRMMHYPRPPDGISGFQSYKISISSYTGEARVYLENLVKACGAEFTKTFKQDNTHLITAHTQSEKCEAAKEWNVHVVNHLWLEESYAKCKQQTLTNPRYTYFPSRTNLGEVLGQTEIDRDAVEKFFFSKARKMKAVKEAAQQDGVPGSSAPVSRVTSDPVPRSSPLAEKTRRTKSGPELATPSAVRRIDGKENETPGTTGSRGAKDRAMLKLHDAAPDIAKFEKEMKRKGGVIHGGRRERDAEAGEKGKKTKGRESVGSKRSFDEVEDNEEDSVDEISPEPAKNKKVKKGKLPPIKFRMLLSKDERWANNPDKESRDKNKMREIGLFIMDQNKNVDILCAPKVVRTRKFVTAFASAPTLVSTSYLDSALKNNKLPPPEKHPLLDREFEKTHGIRLDEALERAKQNKKHLLKNWTIFVTEAVSGGYETFRDIIEANGGQCSMWKGRTTNVTASKRTIDASNEVSQNQEEDEGDVLYLVSEKKKQEFPLWKKFREMAEKHDMIPRIVTTEWLLFVAMAQYVHFDSKWELNEKVVNAEK
ncbi:hypothetical protein K469DRAFT_658761 [Zopfia rhizophila CBS 207.26]|uniref:BRCT domain-containing protein n=1 Tax=Zopfia rhizophila CBS 207.26 TaxID=1314779 RepID=A0A6A6EGL2_9PEZI|nr:hypothetical protein K469DRAFT_658761 [Zopfia rhizophila CBS 207.26]